jgi:mono/diheme cytochrome c family protein
MKVAILIACGLLFPGLSVAQSSGSALKDVDRANSSRATKDIVPLPSIKTLTAGQAAGKKLFVQRCSVCHLPALPSYTAFGPLLDGNIVTSWGEEAIRQRIQSGSVKMPGFQYTLSAAEIEEIVDYLKTLDFAKKD